MTTDEIKSLIAQTIEGQGDAVDVGGGLAKILNALAEAAEPQPMIITFEIDAGEEGFEYNNKSKSEAAAILGISESELDRVMALNIPFANILPSETTKEDGIQVSGSINSVNYSIPDKGYGLSIKVNPDGTYYIFFTTV